MASNRNRAVLAVALAALAVVAGCAGAGLGGSGGDGGEALRNGGGDGGDGGLAATADGADGGDGGGGDGSGQLPTIEQRQIIYTGNVVLQVDDFAAARRNLTEAARARGGFVSDARARLHDADEATYRTGVVVLRVPRENFSALMARVEASGTVLNSETSSEDVTDQLVDIEARLESLRSQRDRLRELYASANDTEAVLAVERRLSEVQTEIERLEARQASLQRQVAYSTITVEIREERPEPEVERWYDVGVIGAFLASVDGVGTTLRALSVGIAYALPYLFVFGAPVGAVAVVWRRRRNGG